MAVDTADRSAVIDTEAGSLSAEIVFIILDRSIGVQEDAVLDLDPLCIDDQTALRQRRKVRLLRAGVVQIPALHHKAVVLGLIVLVRTDIRAVSNVLLFLQRRGTRRLSFNRLVVAVHEYAVHVDQRIRVTVEVDVQRAVERYWLTAVVIVGGRILCADALTCSAVRGILIGGEAVILVGDIESAR